MRQPIRELHLMSVNHFMNPFVLNAHQECGILAEVTAVKYEEKFRAFRIISGPL